jgi:hypothetical protein
LSSPDNNAQICLSSVIDANPIWFTQRSSAYLCIHVLDYDDLRDDKIQGAAITLLNPMFAGERSTRLNFMEIISEDVEELNHEEWRADYS